MRAYEIRNGFGMEYLHPVERPDPEPGVGEVLVAVRAVSLNFRDLLVIKGQYNPRLPMPRIPCSDAVGEVSKVGPGVTRVQVGDRVAGTFLQQWLAGPITQAYLGSDLGASREGVLAELVVLPEEGVVAVPSHLSDEEAATLPCAALTAWHALFAETAIRPGDTVLLQGTGGVSLFALQFARLAGAGVLITSSSEEKLARAGEMGAEAGINYKTTPDWGDRARDLTGKQGVDLVVEVGGAGTLPQSIRAVRPGGTISLIGVLAGGGEFNPIPLLMKSIRLQGIFVGSRAMFEDMNRAISLHHMRPVVDRVFAFAEVRQALEHMEQGKHFGKIVIRL
jgi:NADPH:quinone reductase-like Zn-dependent oxidoreductase